MNLHALADPADSNKRESTRKVDVRLPGIHNGARPVHLIITMIKWIRTSRLSIKNSLSGVGSHTDKEEVKMVHDALADPASRIK